MADPDEPSDAELLWMVPTAGEMTLEACGLTTLETPVDPYCYLPRSLDDLIAAIDDPIGQPGPVNPTSLGPVGAPDPNPDRTQPEPPDHPAAGSSQEPSAGTSTDVGQPRKSAGRPTELIAGQAKTIWARRLGGESVRALADEFGFSEQIVRSAFRRQADAAAKEPGPRSLVLNPRGEVRPKSAAPTGVVSGEGAGDGADRPEGTVGPEVESEPWRSFAEQLRQAHSRWDAGRRQEAIELAGQVVDASALLLGDKDPRSLTLRADLAVWRGKAGDAGGAVAELETVLAGRKMVLGHQHADTRETQAILGRWRDVVKAADLGARPSDGRRRGAPMKIDHDAAQTIRDRFRDGERQDDLAREFEVNVTTINRVIRGLRSVPRQ
jgi:hypothetical protein